MSLVLTFPQPPFHTAACAASAQNPLTPPLHSIARSTATTTSAEACQGKPSCPQILCDTLTHTVLHVCCLQPSHAACVTAEPCLPLPHWEHSFWVPNSGIQLPVFMELVRIQLSLKCLSNVVELGYWIEKNNVRKRAEIHVDREMTAKALLPKEMRPNSECWFVRGVPLRHGASARHGGTARLLWCLGSLVSI